MSTTSRLLVAALPVLGISSAATAGPITFSSLQGEWLVYNSELADPEGVQAYSDDQLRAIVGNRLIVTADSVRWDISHGRAKLREHTSFNEVCVQPAVTDAGDDHYAISCVGDDVFAPGLTMMRNGELVVLWWDGVTLYLRKQK